MQAPLVSRLPEDQPPPSHRIKAPATGCPGWCVNHKPGVHLGSINAADGVTAWLVQSDNAYKPVILVDYAHKIALEDAATWAQTFARLSAPALAATIKRLAEAGVVEQPELAHAGGE